MASHYLGIHTMGVLQNDGTTTEGHSYQIWRIEDDVAYRADVMDGSGIDRHTRVGGEELITTLRKRYPGLNFCQLQLAPGEYHPRMARPRIAWPITGLPGQAIDPSPGRNPNPDPEFISHSRVRSTGQLHALIQEIDQICRVVHPVGTNLQVYGHAIRNILLSACMEVETQWKLILRDNRYPKEPDRLNTTDYVKLLLPFKLGEYIVNLNYYPWLDPISPFVCWSKEAPTKSLSWYSAYNSTKHDRELNFAEANLRRALAAVTACFVMLCAQYGRDFAAEGDRAQREFFGLIRAPSWHPSEYYVEGEPLVRKPYFAAETAS